MTGIVQDIDPRVVAGGFQEALEGIPVVQVLPGMDFITNIHIFLIEMIQDGFPTFRQFGEAHFHQPGRPLRPRVERMPEQGP